MGDGLLERIMACGISEKEAERIINRYTFFEDFSGLERYVRALEMFNDDRKEYPKED